VNEERQIKKILDKAEIFKSRANKGPEDGKRHDLIEPDEQRYMRIAYDKLGWSYARIGAVFERDPRAVAKMISESSKPKDEHKVQDEEEIKSNAKHEPSANAPSSSEEKPLVCSASPDGIDVNVLKSWGVPLRKRAELLSKWRKWHECGMHDICEAFTRLQQDIKVRKFSYKVAEMLLENDIWALEFQVEELHKAIDLFRTYRPREHTKSYQVFMNDLEEMHKSNYKVNTRHLNDIEKMLNELRKAVLISRDTKEYEGVLKMEEDPLFEILESHCFDVYDFFWNLKNDLETVRSLDLSAVRVRSNRNELKIRKRERTTLQKKVDNSIKDLQRAIDFDLRNKTYSASVCHLCIQNNKPETNS